MDDEKRERFERFAEEAKEARRMAERSERKRDAYGPIFLVLCIMFVPFMGVVGGILAGFLTWFYIEILSDK